MERIAAPTLIILDLNLPVMGGLDFLKELRADAELRTTVVVVYSTSSASTDIRAAYDSLASAFLVKDEQTRPLKELVECYLEDVRLPG